MDLVVEKTQKEVELTIARRMKLEEKMLQLEDENEKMD